MSLLVVGSVAFDSIETPFGRRERIIGGAATYISLAASYLTGQVNLVSVVGEDFAEADIDMLRAHGVDTQGLQQRAGEKSFFWSGRYHLDLNTRDTLVTELNVLADFDPIVPEAYQSCQYLMLGNLAPSVQSRVLEQLAVRPKLVVMDTMNFWMEVALEDLRKTLSQVDVLSVNDEEARQLSGERSLLKAAALIQQMGPSTVIIKKGEHGALLFGPTGELFFAPALLLDQVQDPTGAGDSFAGGFIGHLAATGDLSFENMKRAVLYGSALASLCVERFGPERLVSLAPGELQTRLAEFRKMVDVTL